MPELEPVVAAIYAKLGGKKALHMEVSSEADLARAVLHRIPITVLTHVQKEGFFSRAEIQQFVIPVRTQRHRTKKKEPLTVEESDRLVRLTRVQALAEDVFGDQEKAKNWLRTPLGELSGKRPIELSRTEVGARVVEQILAKIDWGAAA